MDRFKKARDQLKGAVKDAQGYAQQFQGQYTQQPPNRRPNDPGQQQGHIYQHGKGCAQYSGYPPNYVGCGDGMPPPGGYTDQCYPGQQSVYPQHHGYHQGAQVQNPPADMIHGGGLQEQPSSSQGYYHSEPVYSSHHMASHPQPLSHQNVSQQKPPYDPNYIHYDSRPSTYIHGQVSVPPGPSEAFNIDFLSQTLPSAGQVAPIGTVETAALRDFESDQSYPPERTSQLDPHSTPAILTPPLNKLHSMASPVAPTVPRGRPTSTISAIACPLYEAALADIVEFFVLENHVIKDRETKLDPDSFAICGACFSAAIFPYPDLAAAFKRRDRVIREEGLGMSLDRLVCGYALPRVKNIFHNECVIRNSIEPLVRFAFLNLTLPKCAGVSISTPTAYYSATRAKKLGVCKSCFEQYLRGTTFEREMSLTVPLSAWICEIGLKGYVFKALISELNDIQPHFPRFVSKIQVRLQIFCNGSDKPVWPEEVPGPCYTYEPPDSTKAGVFCEACFLDKVAGTSMEPFFGKRTALDEEFHGNIGCDLGDVPSKYAMDIAIRAGDDEVWRRCITKRSTLPMCDGIKGVDEDCLPTEDPWYCFKEYPSIEICPFCYAATIELLGATHLFTAITRPLQAGVFRLCYLATPSNLDADASDGRNFENTLVWRGTILRRWVHQGYDAKGDFSGLKFVAKMIAGWAPPCVPGRWVKASSGRKWLGNLYYFPNDAHRVCITMCEECFEDYVKGTTLERQLGHDLTERVRSNFPNGFDCNVCTRRCQDELGDACAENNWSQFAEYWTKRREVELRREAIDKLCNEQAKAQLIQKQMADMQGAIGATRLMQQLTANTNATIMGTGGSVSEAAATDYGQRYGNSAVGYGYLAAGGANAAQAHVDAQNLSRQGLSVMDYKATGDTWQDTQQLLAIFNAVEAEWNGIK
jgi:hypothetical protein